MAIRTALILLHLVGLVIGLGAATIADLLFFNCLLQNRISTEQFSTLKKITDLVVVGLLILGATGFGFLALYAFIDPHLMTNPKLWAKISMIIVLSANGYFMHDFVLPMFEKNLNRPLFSVPAILENRVALFAAGAISGTSWWAILLLGVWKELNFNYSYGQIMAVYGVILGGAIVSSPIAGKVVVRIAKKIAPAALQEVFEGRAVWGRTNEQGVGPCYALLRKEIRRAERKNEELSVISLQFDQIRNLREGRDAESLSKFDTRLTDMIYDQLRDNDHLGALGEGKFMLILPMTDKVGADIVFNRIADACAKAEFRAGDLGPVDDSAAERPGLVFECRAMTLKPTIDHTVEQVVRELDGMPLHSSHDFEPIQTEGLPALRLVS